MGDFIYHLSYRIILVISIPKSYILQQACIYHTCIYAYMHEFACAIHAYTHGCIQYTHTHGMRARMRARYKTHTYGMDVCSLKLYMCM